jgi:hypothetical protein
MNLLTHPQVGPSINLRQGPTDQENRSATKEPATTKKVPPKVILTLCDLVGEAEGTTEDVLMIELAAELLIKLAVGVAAPADVPLGSDVVVFRVAGRQHWTSQSFSSLQRLAYRLDQDKNCQGYIVRGSHQQCTG